MNTLYQLQWLVLSDSEDRRFFFSSRRRHTRLQGDWSSDVCSSDLDHGRRSCRASENNVQVLARCALDPDWNTKGIHLRVDRRAWTGDRRVEGDGAFSRDPESACPRALGGAHLGCERVATGVDFGRDRAGELDGSSIDYPLAPPLGGLPGSGPGGGGGGGGHRRRGRSG